MIDIDFSAMQNKLEKASVTVPVPVQVSTITEQPLEQPKKEILDAINNLRVSLQESDPDIINYVRHIHKALLEDVSQVTILTNEQRAVFFAGLSAITKEQIIAKEIKGKAGKGSKAGVGKLKDLSMDDFV